MGAPKERRAPAGPRLRSALPLCALLVVVPACDDGEAPRAPASPARVKAADGLCEHGVLEALCTKHNPALIAVFRAKGDFCEEHGLPESVCPICHPERKGRPGVDVSTDEAPADGTQIRFKTKDTARLAGLETTKAEAGSRVPEAEALVRIVYDATKVAVVSARAPGVVKRLHVDVGAKVKAGDVLVTLDSADVGQDRSRLSGARARLEAARAALERERGLLEQGVSAKKDVEAAEREHKAALAEVAAAESALRVVGAGDVGAGGYRAHAPLDGVVTRRSVSLGTAVAAEDVLFEVVDPSSMWAELEVAEQDLAHVAAGQRARIELDALPGRAFEGTLDFLAPWVDPRTRTALARVRLENDDGALRANFFGRARIALPTGPDAVVVPRAAVQRAKGQAFVYVKRADDLYEARRVKTGLMDDEVAEIRSGLSPGEEVVTTGSFLLKTETLKGAIGAGCCE